MFKSLHTRLAYFAQRHYQRGTPKLPHLISGLNRRINGIDIDPAAQIGENLTIVHPVGIVIGGEAVVGNNVVMQQGVGLGHRRGPVAGDGMPTIEDDVYISTGAKLMGPITIGRGAVIGANAVVLKDVPPYATAVGIPARILALDTVKREAWDDTRHQIQSVLGNVTTA